MARRQLLRGAIVWGCVFGLTALLSIVAYKSTYGTPADRAKLLGGLTANSGIRALFGPAREVDTVAGFTAWRTLGLLPLIAGVWGLLATTRVLRGEEDRGRWETLLTAPITRASATLATLAGFGIGCLALYALTAVPLLLAGTVPGELETGGTLWLALALTMAAPAFGAVGALASQLAPTRRSAAAIAGAVFALAFLVRVAADGSQSLGWLRWLTPLGWIEEMRPLTGDRLLPLLPLVAWTAGLSGLAVAIARRRDAGAAALARRGDRRPRHALLSPPLAFSLRESLGGLAGWCAALALAGFVFGFVSKAVADIARESAAVRTHVEETTSARIDITSAEGYLALVFVFLAVALCCYAASHATAVREEEATGRLDTILAQPAGRRAWLGGRVLVAAACCVAAVVAMSVAAWAGATTKDAGVGLADLLAAGLNTLPVVALFLGVGVLALAAVPRHTGAIAYGAVGAAYLWEQTGAILRAPEWVLSVSPFHWLALVPSEPADLSASAAMVAIGLVAATAGIERFRRRDLVPA